MASRRLELENFVAELGCLLELQSLGRILHLDFEVLDDLEHVGADISLRTTL